MQKPLGTIRTISEIDSFATYNVNKNCRAKEVIAGNAKKGIIIRKFNRAIYIIC